MAERGGDIDKFLAAAGWSGAARAPLAGDASARRYLRLTRGGDSAVLTDSEQVDIAAFCRIARHLDGLGYSAPKIYAEDSTRRLLLLEDMGDHSFTHCLEDGGGPSGEALYSAAVDLLTALASAPVAAGAPAMDAAYLAAEIRLFAEWWPPEGGGESELKAHADGWAAAWCEAHVLALAMPQCLSLRDFHAANLMWLPERQGIARVGLLDFQDAVAAPLPYDLVSLLQDVRRDVPGDLEAEMIARFLGAFPELDREAFRASYAILGAHRNLRIAGVFSRLAGRDGKRGYLAYLPRVWRHIDADLRHPALAPVADWLARFVPPGERESGR